MWYYTNSQHNPMMNQLSQSTNIRLLIGLALGLLSVSGPTLPKPTSPNIIVILADDLGYGDLGCFGHKTIQTPYLDKMAAEGLRLTNCYSAAPVCSPSRAGLITGKIPTRLAIDDWIPEDSDVYLQQGELTIPALLKRANYQTGMFGKWHLNGRFNQPQQPQPGDHGFGYWFATQNNADPSHHNPTNFVQNGQPTGPLEGYSCQIVAKKAVDWLKNRDKNRPFYGHICFHEPHEPVASPEALVKRYEGQSPRERAEYYANVSNLDDAVGQLMATLKSEGLLENTLVIFTSDNGPETLLRGNSRHAAHSYGMAHPMRGRKLWLYEGGIRVPGIVYWKGRIRPRVSDEPVASLDFLPTLARLAGLPLTDVALDGTDVSGFWLRNEPIKRPQPLFWFYYNAIDRPKAALRDGKWKLVGFPDTTRRWIPAAEMPKQRYKLHQMLLKNIELYDLVSDPGETLDLSKAEPEVTRRLTQKMRQTKDEVLKETNRN